MAAEKTLDTIRQFGLALKGPLTTPVGQGIRSLNVQIRQILDLYVCLRPVRYFAGVPSPMRHPELVDMVIFRENTEDVYSGIEWPAESAEAIELIEWIEKKTGKKLNPDSGIGIKPISRSGTQRLVRRAIEYALRRKKPSVTLVHKGNIMKFTEGAFRTWGYELAQNEFPNETLTEAEFDQQPDDKLALCKSHHQRPDCRYDVPAGPLTSVRILGHCHRQSERGLSFRCPGGPGWGLGHGPGGQPG